ncbi:hypothetical protein GGR56DRAFT_670517 [Xylariaceae sp. FL0804]|nr:hypothetical protein GGR56DRAFT_670517 [Xylariaceae sp. FL0804]
MSDISPLADRESPLASSPGDTRHQFTLGQLRETFNIQSIHGDAQQLLNLIVNFQSYYRSLGVDAPRIPLHDDDLISMLGLSKNITTCLSEIIDSRQDAARGKRREASVKNSNIKRRRSAGMPRRHTLSPTCTFCSTTDTPKWRSGPEGAGTLCNVCGLIYRKRKGRSNTPMDEGKASCSVVS